MTQSIDIKIGGFSFRARAEGPTDGPLVLMLHGFPQTSYTWRAQLPALAAAGFRAIAPDQRGYSSGARPDGVEHYKTSMLVADAMAMADALGRQRFHLVGHDWGGALSWLAAAWHPDRIASLTVLSRPHPDAFARAMAEDAGQQHRSRHHKAFQDPETERLLLEHDARRLRRNLKNQNVPDDAIDAYVEVLIAPGALTAALNWYRATGGDLSKVKERGHRPIGAIAVPTLYVWGNEDATVGPAAATWTADHVEPANFRLEVVPRAGHFLTDEGDAANLQINRALLAHLAAHAI